MGSATLLKGRRILIVEDHPMIRLELTNLFESVGAQVVAAAKFEQAVMAIGQYSICAALLDHRLQEGNVAPMYALLTKFQIPYMIYTGYPDLEQIYPYAIIVQKPASTEVLLATMARLISHVPISRAADGGRRPALSLRARQEVQVAKLVADSRRLRIQVADQPSHAGHAGSDRSG